MQGNCLAAAAPEFVPISDAAPLRPMLPGQCLVVADHDVIVMKNAKIWVDNLFVRLAHDTDTAVGGLQSDVDNFMWLQGDTMQLFMTNVTLQGSGMGIKDLNNVVHVESESAVYLEGTLHFPPSARFCM